MATTLVIVGVTLVLPFTPLGGIFGFGALPTSFILAMAVIVVAYILSAEVVKRVFYRRVKF